MEFWSRTLTGSPPFLQFCFSRWSCCRSITSVRPTRSQAICISVTQMQIAWDRVGLTDVIERQHDQREKQNCRNGGDPVSVRDQNSILIGRRREAHHLEPAAVGGNEAQAGNPS